MRRVVPIRRAQERRRDELAFLPAALEIVETPPSPIGRAIGGHHHRCCSARPLAWAASGTIDIVASATGKIVPSGRTKVIQPFETGVVRAIHVQDGQTVKAGDVLIELDPTMNAAERDHLQSDLVAERSSTSRGLRRRSAAIPIPWPTSSRRREARPGPGRASQRQFLINQVAEQRAKIAALDRQQAQKEAERATDRGDHRQARGDDPGAPAAGRHPQDALRPRDRARS